MQGSDQPFPMNDRGASTAPAPLIPGHELLRRIARGSYGEIWLARTELGAFRAVKLIRRASFADARPYDREFAGIQRYEPVSREHEGLVDVLQVGRDEPAGFFYYVMELADDANSKLETRNPERGTIQHPPSSILHSQSYAPLTLSHVIRQRQHLPVSEVIELGIGLAHALEFLHSRRLVHRDVKPSNIIFVGGQPKLADVGLVADLGNPQSLVGTLGYIPPEGPGTAQADIYSLGKVLYEAATGKDRQEFPDLPTRLGEGHDDPALPELNEVLLKACEGQARARYRSAGDMAADLERLKAGQSLRARRVHQSRLRSIAITTACCAGLGLVGAGLFALVQHERSKPRLLFHDDFSGNQLDTRLWTLSEKNFGTPGLGKRWSQPMQSGGELVLQVRADHEEGLTTGKSLWADSKLDFRKLAPCRFEIELAGKSEGGHLLVGISTGELPKSDDDVCGAKLLDWDATTTGRSNLWPTAHLRIDLLTKSGPAVVYPDTNNLEDYEVVNLSEVPIWRLRFISSAVTSSGISSGTSDFRIRDVVCHSLPESEWIVGHVLDELTDRPLADALVKSPSGTLVKTRANGAFVVPLGTSSGSLIAEREGYSASEMHLTAVANLRAPLTARIHKLKQEFGDVVSAIRYGDLDVRSIGFVQEHLTVLVSDSVTACRLLPVNLATGRIEPMAPEAKSLEFAPDDIVQEFVESDRRLVGVRRWHGAVVDLSVNPPKTMLELFRPQDLQSRLDWPEGAAFDGEFLWFLEADRAYKRFAMHAVDLEQSLFATNSLLSLDVDIQGLAWDGKQFWISTAKGWVYQIDRTKALTARTVQAGIGRRFPGYYYRLTFGLGYLWGLDREKRLICKVKVSD